MFRRKIFCATKGYGEDMVSYVYDGSVIIPTGLRCCSASIKYSIHSEMFFAIPRYLIYLNKVFFPLQVHVVAVNVVVLVI